MAAAAGKNQSDNAGARRAAPQRKRGQTRAVQTARLYPAQESAGSRLLLYGALTAAPIAALLLLLCIWQIDENLQSVSAALPPANADFIAKTDRSAQHSANSGLAFAALPQKQAVPLPIPNQAVQLPASGAAEFSANMRSLHKGLIYSTLSVLAAALCLIILILNYRRREKQSRQTCLNLLENADSLAESRARRRAAKLEAARNTAEKERQRAELLLQDSSHRIGNSLATVSSLLGLQLSQCRDEAGRQALLSAQSRIQAIAAAHRRLRLGKDMETAPVSEFLAAVIHDIEGGLTAESRRNITIKTHFEQHYLPARDVTTLGIILGELLTNAVKHAFPTEWREGERKGQIAVSFGRMGAKHLRLIVEDNGIGLSPETPDKAAPGSKEHPHGLGRLILEQLAAQFNSRPHYAAAKNGGARVTIPVMKV